MPADLALRGTALGERANGLRAAIDAARGHAPDAVLDELAADLDRATGRLRLSARHTVVAIAGATGSGKSSTYNALTGLELSSVGVRRPTTSWATALVWGSEGADDLLQWLGIPPRHQTMRDSMLDSRRGGDDDRDLDGVVLLDLPDHDSTEVSHHLEVDRLVATADLMVWILDPQKYADAAVHDRYFKRLATHQDVILVALNHIDTVPEDRREAMVADVRRLLAEDGLPDVTVLAISAKQGIGLDTLRSEIRRRAEGKAAAADRVSADLASVLGRLEDAAGTVPAREVAAQRVRDLEDAVAEAAGVPAVVDALERTVSRRARSAVAWPPLALLLRGTDVPHEPRMAAADRAGVDTAVRGLADEVGESVGPPWAVRVRAAATARLGEIGDHLDRDLAQVPVSTRLPVWVGALRLLQWLLLLGAVGAAAWYALTLVQDDAPARLLGLPLPAAAAIGALVLGLVLAVVGRFLVGSLASARADDVDEQLREVVHEVLAREVVAPVGAEVTSYAAYRRGVDRARG
ncbi:GTPase [Nocardioides sp.]|uniref:GTPase n=1 Tax=Nocardioides sp. TaxID=35761 RepID=UPI0035157F30